MISFLDEERFLGYETIMAQFQGTPESHNRTSLNGYFLIFQDLEDLIKAKEKEVEKIEQNGLALIQNKKEEVSDVVRSTLRELSQTWADLDHMVILLVESWLQRHVYHLVSKHDMGYGFPKGTE